MDTILGVLHAIRAAVTLVEWATILLRWTKTVVSGTPLPLLLVGGTTMLGGVALMLTAPPDQNLQGLTRTGIGLSMLVGPLVIIPIIYLLRQWVLRNRR